MYVYVLHVLVHHMCYIYTYMHSACSGELYARIVSSSLLRAVVQGSTCCTSVTVFVAADEVRGDQQEQHFDTVSLLGTVCCNAACCAAVGIKVCVASASEVHESLLSLWHVMFYSETPDICCCHVL